jgi:hypothetical protein
LAALPGACAALLTSQKNRSGPLTMPGDVLTPRVVLQELAQRQIDQMIERRLIQPHFQPHRLESKDRDLKRLSADGPVGAKGAL